MGVLMVFRKGELPAGGRRRKGLPKGLEQPGGQGTAEGKGRCLGLVTPRQRRGAIIVGS